jgi:hypothetical protein
MRIYKKNIVRSFAAAAFILTLLVCCSAQTKKSKRPRWNWQKHQAEVIDYAKKYLVSDIESNVPPISFEKWFQTTVGEDAKVDWDINDCGEQTGTSADRGRDFPMCVAANTVKNGFIYITVNIQFGTFSRGIMKMKPVVRSITAGDEIGGEWIDNLSDLPKLITSQEKTRDYLNPNGGFFKVSGNLPDGFKDIDGMLVQTMDYDENGKYVWVSATGGIQVGGYLFEFQRFLLDRKYWFFETQAIGDVRFNFEGEFAKPKFDADGKLLSDNVLHGHLTKFVNGKKAVEANLSFNFVMLSDVPEQNLKISEIKKLKPETGVFMTQGFVVSNAGCPPCPPKKVCKPCQNRILISEENKRLDTTKISEGEMIIVTENPESFVKGKEYTFKIRITRRKSTNEPINDVLIISYKIIE